MSETETMADVSDEELLKLKVVFKEYRRLSACLTELQARRAAEAAQPNEAEFLAQILATIESPEQCCGRGVAVERRGQLEEECCGSPEYGFERAAALIRERLSTRAALGARND